MYIYQHFALSQERSVFRFAGKQRERVSGTKERQVLQREATYRLRPNDSLPARVGAHPRQRTEQVVGEHIDAAVIGLEVVDLLLEDERPEILADKFYRVKGVVEARAVAGESVCRRAGTCQSTWLIGKAEEDREGGGSAARGQR